MLAELVALCNARPHGRRLGIDFVEAVLASDAIRVIWPDEYDFRSSMTLLKARPDKGYSLCYAMSFDLMRRCRIWDALTADHHFEQEGFRRLLN